MVSRISRRPTISSPASIINCSPKISGRLRTGGRVGATAASKAMAASNSGNRQTTWASSAVQSSIPGTAVSPASLATVNKAGQFPQVLWSVRAIMSKPASRAMWTMLLGVMSASPQGDRQE